MNYLDYLGWCPRCTHCGGNSQIVMTEDGRWICQICALNMHFKKSNAVVKSVNYILEKMHKMGSLFDDSSTS